MVRAIIFLLFLTAPAMALDEPVPWRDPDSGCRYWLTPQGGIAPRYRRDGSPDCPDANTTQREISAPIVSDQAIRDAMRQLERGLDAIRRELERQRRN